MNAQPKRQSQPVAPVLAVCAAFAEWEIGHCDADAYCEKFQQFATAMRQIDSGIKLIACGGDGNSSDQSWNETLCQQLGNTADYLGIHNYTPLTGKKFADPKLQYYAVAAAPEWPQVKAFPWRG